MKKMLKTYGWIPSVYLMQGIPYALVNGVAPILYKNFNYSNIKIAFLTSFFILPWLIKPLLAPLFENLISKRNLILIMQSIMVGLILLLAASLSLPTSFLMSGTLFMFLALASSIHDMNADGMYILNLDSKSQAHFIGIRTVAYQMGTLLVQGAFIIIVGYLINYYSMQHSWQINLSALAFTVAIITIYHTKFLPHIPAAIPKKEKVPLRNILKYFVDLPHLTLILIFFLIYNLPQAALLKMLPLFLLDAQSHGGLGLTTESVGIMVGCFGITGMLIGVFISGFLVAKYQLKKCLMPITLLTAFSNTAYLLLSLHPHISNNTISLFIFIAQCSYGLSNGTYMIFLLQVFGKGNYPMSQYAIGTSLMCFGIMLGGALSGYLQYLLGYHYFFLGVIGMGVMMTIFTWYTSNKVLKTSLI